jgi:hypothetical protein
MLIDPFSRPSFDGEYRHKERNMMPEKMETIIEGMRILGLGELKRFTNAW